MAAVVLDVFGQRNGAEEGKEQRRRGNAEFAGCRGLSWGMGRERAGKGAEREFAVGGSLPAPNAESREDGEGWRSKPAVRKPRRESGWRQLQRDADRKTPPRVVTVAPEILGALVDETGVVANPPQRARSRTILPSFPVGTSPPRPPVVSPAVQSFAKSGLSEIGFRVTFGHPRGASAKLISGLDRSRPCRYPREMPVDFHVNYARNGYFFEIIRR